MNDISVVSLVRQLVDKKFEANIRLEALEILKILNQKESCVEIYLVGDKIIKELNGRFRAKNKPTNILSFPEPDNFPHPEIKARFLGEIYLNIPYIKKEGKFEISVLLIHGILHLLGYTHKKKNDRMKMEKKENYVLHRFRHRIVSN
ncbi:rRNA maturation RNase YbeY [Candidatus Wolfebacteria bacterium]|nr:rRNA maturation RNase YbeY [Candidatus Wolfebacteria bacterium]